MRADLRDQHIWQLTAARRLTTRDAVYSLRYRSRLAAGLIDEDVYERLRDRHDCQPNSLSYLVEHEGRALASARVSVWMPEGAPAAAWDHSLQLVGHDLPCFEVHLEAIQRHCGLAGAIVEVSQLVVAPSELGLRCELERELMRMAAANADVHQAEWIVTTATRDDAARLRRCFGMDRLGGARRSLRPGTANLLIGCRHQTLTARPGFCAPPYFEALRRAV